MKELHGRLKREHRTLAAMIVLFCRRHHTLGRRECPCPECQRLLDYAEQRLARCPFGTDKPTCAQCPIHCYRPNEREAVKTVMRFSGPRMLWRHPWLAVGHLLDGLGKTKPLDTAAPKEP